MSNPSLRLEHLRGDFASLTIEAFGHHWRVNIEVDRRKRDGGIGAYIGRDDVLCTSTEFGWTEDPD